MRVADLYFVEELRRTLGLATASAWLLQEQMNRETRALGGEASPVAPGYAASEASSEEARDERGRSEQESRWVSAEDAAAGVDAGGTGFVRGQRAGETSENSRGPHRRGDQVAGGGGLVRNLRESKSESQSPEPSRRQSPGGQVRFATSSNLRHGRGGGEAAPTASHKQQDCSADDSRIQQVLQSGGANAGLIFTDAAHSVDLSSAKERKSRPYT
jgi:hypothetical protein